MDASLFITWIYLAIYGSLFIVLSIWSACAISDEYVSNKQTKIRKKKDKIFGLVADHHLSNVIDFLRIFFAMFKVTNRFFMEIDMNLSSIEFMGTNSIVSFFNYLLLNLVIFFLNLINEMANLFIYL